MEEVFYAADWVMTVSIHKYCEYLHGAGDLPDTGFGKGKQWAIKYAVQDGTHDEAYEAIFKHIKTKVREIPAQHSNFSMWLRVSVLVSVSLLQSDHKRACQVWNLSKVSTFL